jgi:phthalate 4,5-cis-dihydrodiol dehydrogenase
LSTGPGTARLGTVRLGIAGLGPAGALMLSAAFGHDRVTVTAVADTDIGGLGPGTGEPRRYPSLDRLLADNRVDAVHIATPTPAHLDHALRALGAGKHVIIEKPVTATLGEAEELMARATASGRVVIVGHSEGFEPYVQAVREVVASGAVGTVTMVIAEKFTNWMRRPRLPAEWDGARGGGLIRRQGVHQVDVLRTITGADFTVRAAQTRLDPERGVPGSYTAWLASDDGPAAVITHDGVGRLSPAGGRPASGEAGEEGKRSRRQALLRQVLEERAPVRIGQNDTERLIVLAAGGEIVASSRHVNVTTGAGTRAVDLTAFAEGRHAVLDELVAAISGPSGARHDLAWGYESLRTCEDIERAAADDRAAAGTRQAPPA